MKTKINKEEIICHDCGAHEGEIHKFGCDVEKCPFCGGQLISCDCIYEMLGFKLDRTKKYSGLPKEIYENGFPEKLQIKYCVLLEKRGRIPFIFYPWVCARCGEINPDMFMVSNEEWQKYIEIDERDKILCENCYNKIKNLIDSHNK